ncbi:type VI secretion system tip protein TssI/VgrG, partial [Agrobacterium sp. SOY23]
STKRPRIEGTQVAIVAGPEGEEIHPDQYGRIKLWFPWDRKAKKDGTDTCWVRVSQAWGGGTWGAQVIPRIGMEVMVAFVDGDPDKPLVIGVVNNPANSVPYDLPANKTRMVLRSNSHKGDGFNEITFEDEAGKENQFFHAQKDQTTRVLNDRTKRIDRHEVASVGGNRAVEVSGNQKHEIGGSVNTVVGGTGPMAMMAMAGVQALSGQTAGLLSQAAQIAGGGGPGVAAFATTLASSALGFLGAGGLSSREGVVSGPSPRADAGTALAGSGSGVGSDASGLFPLPGIMNTIVSTFKSDSVGVARAEQIGVSKVTNVGQTSLESVGKTKKTTVGERYEINVGKAIFTQTENHTVIVSDKIVLAAPGGVIEINKNGVFIKATKFEVKANAVNFKRGSAGKSTNKPFAEDCSKK